MSNAFQRHGIDHLSASHLNLFVAQPALWAASYLMKRRTPVGPAAHRGTAIECGVEAGLFDPEMPVAECQKLALDKYQSLTRQGFMNVDPRIDKERENIAGSVEVALKELRQYGVPDKPEDGRQHKIEVHLDTVPVPIIGYLDFKWSSHGIIGDLKTTSRIPSEVSPPHCRQAAIYTQSTSGNYETRMMYVSSKKVAVYRVDDCAKHIDEIVAIAHAIENFLSLSDDPERLVRSYYPDKTSFYWGDQSAIDIAQEIWGTVPLMANSAVAV